MSSDDRLAQLERKIQHLTDRQEILDCIVRNSRGNDRFDDGQPLAKRVGVQLMDARALLGLLDDQVGVHDVHYAMVVILAMGIGLFAPPFGVGYYAACAISRINPDEGMKPIVGYMVALLIGTLIVAAVPWISTGFL